MGLGLRSVHQERNKIKFYIGTVAPTEAQALQQLTAFEGAISAFIA